MCWSGACQAKDPPVLLPQLLDSCSPMTLSPRWLLLRGAVPTQPSQHLQAESCQLAAITVRGCLAWMGLV